MLNCQGCFFFKGKTFLGLDLGVCPRKLDLVWCICGEPRGCSGVTTVGHSARLGAVILLLPEPQVPGIFP